MKKLLISIIILMFFVISCHSSKKTENDADVLPDEDAVDEDTEEKPDEEKDYPIYDGEDEFPDNRGEDWEKEPETESPCENFANTDGMIRYYENGNFECGCVEGYYWGHLGCKKITYSNICTGQKNCYDWWNYTNRCADAGNLSGQDPYYSREGYCLKQTFSKTIYYADESISIDDNLHISWMDKISPGVYTWDDAVAYCSNLKYGGKDDWRLPLPEELLISPKDLYDYDALWSSGELEQNKNVAWVFYGGRNLQWTNKSTKASARCVRGNSLAEDGSLSSSSRFQTVEINGVEIIRDLKSGIIWQTNFAKAKPWSDGLVFCEHSDFAGFSDWRVPNINELLFLKNFNEGSISSPIDTSELTTIPYFWSSTTKESVENLPAYGLNFRDGQLVNILRSQYGTGANAVCIRNDPCREGYWWNGKKCAKSPCDEKPCEKVKHSDGMCGTEDFETYYCGCEKGYFWNGVKCVNPCDEKPCTKHSHATEECRAISDSLYICGCDKSYWWWGKNKGCLAKRPEIANICTGQTNCYDAEKRIKCPAEGEEFYGQDAQYAALGTCVPKNYKVNTSVENEPTVYDINTGLEWQQNIRQEAYLSWSGIKSYCAALNYGGYNDWRVPTFDELRSILDFDSIPLVNDEYFPNTPATTFWTSSDTTILDRVYAIDFETADFGEFTWKDSYSGEEYVILSGLRCVRGDTYEIEPRHTAEIEYKEDDAVYGNPVTGLLWTKILPEESAMIFWVDYLKYCEDLNTVGLSNWRLANINELYSISLRERFVDFGISSTTKLDNPESVFGGGIIFKDYRRPSYIVCVTENPCNDDEIWNGKKCVEDKCRHDICGNKGVSMGSCIPGKEGDPGYSCRCYKNYHWDSKEMICVEDPEEEEIPDSE